MFAEPLIFRMPMGALYSKSLLFEESSDSESELLAPFPEKYFSEMPPLEKPDKSQTKNKTC
jgi:hypothetical protein